MVPQTWTCEYVEGTAGSIGFGNPWDIPSKPQGKVRPLPAHPLRQPVRLGVLGSGYLPDDDDQQDPGASVKTAAVMDIRSIRIRDSMVGWLSALLPQISGRVRMSSNTAGQPKHLPESIRWVLLPGGLASGPEVLHNLVGHPEPVDRPPRREPYRGVLAGAQRVDVP